MYLILIFQKVFLVFAWCILCTIVLELLSVDFLKMFLQDLVSFDLVLPLPISFSFLKFIWFYLFILQFENLTFIRWLWFICIDYNHRYIWTYTIIPDVCFFNSPVPASFLVICLFKFFSTNKKYMCASRGFHILTELCSQRHNPF